MNKQINVYGNCQYPDVTMWMSFSATFQIAAVNNADFYFILTDITDLILFSLNMYNLLFCHQRIHPTIC